METEEYLNQLTKEDLEKLSNFIDDLMITEAGNELEYAVLDAVMDDIRSYIDRWKKIGF